ncbi:MAG: hypothetical protein CMD75_00870 [Gammaproteobacteria bacterium]|nr:hypothetical protein [Gammaproteobacteria bacterium]|tara:strand:- start:2000 stop:2947 length:948 start_codon:yes stop_codon:yes gene_type:complete
MKNFNLEAMKFHIYFLVLIFSIGNVYSETALTELEIKSLEASYSQMNIAELNAEVVTLTNANETLNEVIENSQNPAKVKAASEEKDENDEKLLLLLRFIAAIGGGAVLSEIGSDSDKVYPDNTPPTVSIIGDNPITVELGSTYTDPGITATDDSGGQVTVTTSGTVDTNTAGTYTITYTATDSSGNSTTVTRTVIVEDTTPPTITSPSTFSAAENQSSIGQVIVSDSSSVTFSVSGSDNITIDENGVLSFIVPPDYETQTEYTIVVTVTDANGNSVSQTITITITNDPDDDDDDGTGTGTGTGTSTGGGTGTGTG